MNLKKQLYLSYLISQKHEELFIPYWFWIDWNVFHSCEPQLRPLKISSMRWEIEMMIIFPILGLAVN